MSCDQVVCIVEAWIVWKTGEETRGPGKGDVCTIAGHHKHHSEFFYELAEWPNEYWQASNFRPVRPTSIEEIKRKALKQPTPELV